MNLKAMAEKVAKKVMAKWNGDKTDMSAMRRSLRRHMKKLTAQFTAN
jgi:hypothetical protein